MYNLRNRKTRKLTKRCSCVGCCCQDKPNTVENGVEGDESEDTNLDDNKNEILAASSPSENSCQSDGEEATEGDIKGSNQSNLTARVVSPVREKKAEQTAEEKVNAILREIQQSVTPESEKSSPSTKSTLDDRHRVKALEEAKIAELLNRGDTAVVIPESVSDTEDQLNGDGALSEEEVVLKCIHCPKTFLRANILRDHMREEHADKPLKFMCPKCDETFHQKCQLDKHLTLHSPTSQICSVCNKTFANVYRLQRHMISHNESNDLRKFKCHECGKAFKFKHHLKEHVRIHSGEKPFVCNNCGKRFSHSGSYSSHTTSKKCWGLTAGKSRVGQDGISGQNLSQNQTSSPSIGSFPGKLPMAYNKSKVPSFERSPLQAVPVSMAHQQHFVPPHFGQKGVPAFYYPPQIFATADGFLHPVYSVAGSLPSHAANMSLAGVKSGDDTPKEAHSSTHYNRSRISVSPAHSQSTRSFSPLSRSGRSVSPSSSSTFSISSPPHAQYRRSVTPISLSSAGEATTPIDRGTSKSPGTESMSPDVNSNAKLTFSKDQSTSEAESVEHSKVGTVEVKKEVEDAEKETTTDNLREVAPEVNIEKSSLACHYCKDVFESPVTLHQHERYMCKSNKDLLHHRAQSETCPSPHSTVSDQSHVEHTPNGSIGNESDEEEVEELYKDTEGSYDEKKMRQRSLFTEEQQNYLKKQYNINPRPRKFELIRMGNKIGFPKRVVQVWFQNMRARERKMRRDSGFSLPTIKADPDKEEQRTSPTYIPNVPKPFPMLSSHQSSPTPPAFQGSQSDAPLDLSVRKSPPLAHGGSVSRQTSPDISNDDQVLNLSVKKDSSTSRETSVEKSVLPTGLCETPRQKTMQDSAIYKYLQHEGILNQRLPQQLPPSLYAIQNQIIHQSLGSILKMPHYSAAAKLEIPKVSMSSFSHINQSENSNDSKLDVSDSRLVIDEASKDIDSPSRNASPALSKASEMSVQSGSEMSSILLRTPDMTHPHEDMHNLATLAEAAQRAALLPGKPKRMRKKTWRQMESEEVQLEFDDTASTDDDQPSKKKRKSWKNHRVDRDEGMYGCDQCNKVFSKQSSLARHKYEHSGARPFACDMCTKSFKHKHHLTEHKRLHSGEKPFQCKKCGKRFSHSGSFSQHMNHRYNYCSPHKMSDGDGDLSSQESP